MLYEITFIFIQNHSLFAPLMHLCQVTQLQWNYIEVFG